MIRAEDFVVIDMQERPVTAMQRRPRAPSSERGKGSVTAARDLDGSAVLHDRDRPIKAWAAGSGGWGGKSRAFPGTLEKLHFAAWKIPKGASLQRDRKQAVIASMDRYGHISVVQTCGTDGKRL